MTFIVQPAKSESIFFQIKSLMLVPPLVVFLAKHPLVDKYDLSHVQMIGCGAAPLSQELAKAVIKRLGGQPKILVMQGARDLFMLS